MHAMLEVGTEGPLKSPIGQLPETGKEVDHPDQEPQKCKRKRVPPKLLQLRYIQRGMAPCPHEGVYREDISAPTGGKKTPDPEEMMIVVDLTI
jgi:hypothetical protein